MVNSPWLSESVLRNNSELLESLLIWREPITSAWIFGTVASYMRNTAHRTFASQPWCKRWPLLSSWARWVAGGCGLHCDGLVVVYIIATCDAPLLLYIPAGASPGSRDPWYELAARVL